MREQGKKDREDVKRGSDGGREEGINVEEKERRLGDITVSSHRPVLHCSYKDEHHRGGVREGGERERTNEKHQERKGRKRERFSKTGTREVFRRHLVPSDEQTFTLHSQGIWQTEDRTRKNKQSNGTAGRQKTHMK